MRIKYATILAQDMEDSIRFYTNVMGFAIERRFDLGPAGAITLLHGEGETRVEIIQNPTDSPGLYSIGIEVDDLEATVQDLKQKGVNVSMEPVPITVGYLAIVEDPNGAPIALIQHR